MKSLCPFLVLLAGLALAAPLFALAGDPPKVSPKALELVGEARAAYQEKDYGRQGGGVREQRRRALS